MILFRPNTNIAVRDLSASNPGHLNHFQGRLGSRSSPFACCARRWRSGCWSRLNAFLPSRQLTAPAISVDTDQP